MKPGQFAASDGSFGRSAGAAGLRGMLLLAVAVLIGVVLLNATDNEPPGTDVRAGASTDDGDNRDDDEEAGGSTTTVGPTTTTAALRPPGEVKVVVANASGVDGAAKKVSDELKTKSYNVLAPTNSPAKVEATVVYGIAGYERDAQGVAVALGLPPAQAKPMPAPTPITDLRTAQVLVMVGPELANRLGAAAATTTTAAAGAPATTTTARAGATASTTTTAAPAATTTTKKP